MDAPEGTDFTVKRILLAALILFFLTSCGRATQATRAHVYYDDLPPGLSGRADFGSSGHGTLRLMFDYTGTSTEIALIQHELLHLLGAFYHNPLGCILSPSVSRSYYETPCEADMQIIRGARYQMSLVVEDMTLGTSTGVAIHWLNLWAGWELFRMED